MSQTRNTTGKAQTDKSLTRTMLIAFIGVLTTMFLALVIKAVKSMNRNAGSLDRQSYKPDGSLDTGPSSTATLSESKLQMTTPALNRAGIVRGRVKQIMQMPIVIFTVIMLAILTLISPVAEQATLSCQREYDQLPNCVLTYELFGLITVRKMHIYGLNSVNFNYLRDRYGEIRGESVELRTREGDIRAGMISYSNTRAIRNEIESHLSNPSESSWTIVYHNPPVFYCTTLCIVGLLLFFVILSCLPNVQFV